MALSDLRHQPHLSCSSINDFMNCGLHYKFSRIDRREPQFQSDALEFGSAIHEALAEYHQSRKDGKVIGKSELLDRFDHYFSTLAKDNVFILYKKGESFESLLHKGQGMLSVFHDQHDPDEFKVLEVEHPFSFMIDDLPVPIIGGIDLIEEDKEGTIIIVDNKTSGKAYSRDAIDQSIQLTIYEMAAKANGFHDREILLRFDVLLKTKIPRFEQYYTMRSEIDRKRVIRKAQGVWEGISKQVFLANDTDNWKCSGCQHQIACADELNKKGVTV